MGEEVEVGEGGSVLTVVVGSSGDGSSDSDTVNDLGLTDVLGEPCVVGGVVEPEGEQAKSVLLRAKEGEGEGKKTYFCVMASTSRPIVSIMN